MSIAISIRSRIAQRLKELRYSRRFKQQDVATALGLHRPSYSMIELEVRDVRISELVMLAVFYDTSVQDLLGPALCTRLRIVRK